MAERDARSGERQPASSMRIKLKYPDVETFIQKYAVNISKGGIFIATKTPKATGTPIRFEFVLADAGATAVIRGEGQVQWVKEFDAAQPTKAHGMGVKFTKLDPESQGVVDRALAFRQRDQSQAGLMPEPTTSPNIASVVAAAAASPASFDSETVSGARPAVVVPPAPPPPVAAETTTSTTSNGVHQDQPVAVAEPAVQPSQASPVAAEAQPSQASPVAADAPPSHAAPVAADAGHAKTNGVNVADLDGLAESFGLSDEKIARALAKPRPASTDADLDALARPPSPSAATVAEAIAELRRMLG